MHTARLTLLVSLLMCSVVADARAQGPVYRERWGYLHLERRRAELLDELRGREASEAAAVADMLVADDQGVPFVPVGNALAHLRGVEADSKFQLRCALGLFVLPEVVDPDGRQPACRSANFSVNLPFSMPSAGEMAFDLVVRDADGARVFERRLTRKTGIDDVRLAQAKVTVPCGEWADGAYEVELRTLIDGEEPRARDPELRWTFHVLRGYQERAELAMGAAVALRKDLEPLPRALLDGVAGRVSRAYTGEAFAVRSDAVSDLLRLERCVQNLEAERAPLDGMAGVIPTGLPDGAQMLPCLLRAAASDQPRPTVVFATGSPSYGVAARRPASPPAREGDWVLRELGDFGVEDRWNVVVLDSPGGGRAYTAALSSALAALPALLPGGAHKPLLVCDREAAAVVALQLAKLKDQVSGVVLVGGGGIPQRSLSQLAGLPVRYVPLRGYPASAAIERLQAYLRSRDGESFQGLDLGMLHERAIPWPYGPAGSLVELRAFARQLFGEG